MKVELCVALLVPGDMKNVLEVISIAQLILAN